MDTKNIAAKYAYLADIAIDTQMHPIYIVHRRSKKEIQMNQLCYKLL